MSIILGIIWLCTGNPTVGWFALGALILEATAR